MCRDMLNPVAFERWTLQKRTSAEMAAAPADEEAPMVSANMNSGRIERIRLNSLVVGHVEDML